MRRKTAFLFALLSLSFSLLLPWRAAGRETDPTPPSPTPASTPEAGAPSEQEGLTEEPSAEENTPTVSSAAEEPAPVGAPPKEASDPTEASLKEGSADRLPVTLLVGEEVRTMPLSEYLPGVLAGEMPTDFHPEALRAQAVAARTYTLHRLRSGSSHPEAALCDSPGCCQAWKSEEALRESWGDAYEDRMTLLRAAVEDTDGVILLWEDEPALACFHASSPGRTEDSASVWGGEVPYLVSVESPETADTVPGLLSEKVFSPEELRTVLTAAHPEAAADGDPAGWIGAVLRDASGRVDRITLCGTALSGTEVRALFSLRSAAFSLAYRDGKFVFSVSGSGHGIGMSQWGANLMADAGSTWQEILAHYYPGTVLGSA